ncbi:MAG: glycosyltransferase family 4 protein [Planctomycetales bacterium]|nr:glycosyltransferase family 4 protein [Planctomycetales bacterium]
MRILQIITVPFFTPRGTAFSSLDRTRALVELGHEVDILTYHLGEDVELPRVSIYRTPHVPLIRQLKMGPSLPKLFLDCLLALKTACWLWRHGPYDMVHVHEESSWWMAGLRWLYSGPVLYDMHSSLAEQLVSFGYREQAIVTRTFRWLERRALQRSQAVIVICPAIGEHVGRVTPEKPTVLIENMPVGWETPNPTDDDIAVVRSQFDLEGRRVLLYTGSFGENQGVELAVDAVKFVRTQFPDVAGLFVGGVGRDLARVEAYVAQRGLQDVIRLPGPRDPRKMPAFLRAAEVLLSPRLRGTNTPLKIYSYMASGRPIVATDLSTHTQVLNNDTAELVAPAAEALADGIIRLLNDPEHASRLAANALAKATEEYAFPVYVEKVAQAISLAISGRR